MKKLAFIFSLLWTLSAAATDIEGSAVLLRGVDKVTGRTEVIEIPMNQPTFFGGVRITPQRCLKKPPEEMPENAAFLLIEEENKNEAFEVVFNGWMFSSNPALSAMEHPIFDIWVLECLSDEPAQKDWETIVPVETPHKAVAPVDVDALEEI